MELGGHAPFIVFPDADLDKAVANAVAAKFQTSGQDCLAANRIFIHADVYATFVERFSDAVAALKVSKGFDEDADIGPLINEQAVAKCAEQVSDAIELGARITAGGNQNPIGPCFFEPTVLADVSREMKISVEETFGPVAALISFDNEEELIQTANDTEYGLVAYVYTNDNSRAWRLSDILEYGMVAVNTAKITGPPIPFGGVKQSGLGREGARQGIEEFTELKYVCMST
jgi:aspartate-semialdehyde dehydrogenase